MELRLYTLGRDFNILRREDVESIAVAVSAEEAKRINHGWPFVTTARLMHVLRKSQRESL